MLKVRFNCVNATLVHYMYVHNSMFMLCTYIPDVENVMMFMMYIPVVGNVRVLYVFCTDCLLTGSQLISYPYNRMFWEWTRSSSHNDKHTK